MPKLRAEDKQDWPSMYVYNASLYEDLISYVTEFLGESEHMGATAQMKELSNDTVEDVQAWCKRRKELLLEDFITYYTQT